MQELIDVVFEYCRNGNVYRTAGLFQHFSLIRIFETIVGEMFRAYVIFDDVVQWLEYMDDGNCFWSITTVANSNQFLPFQGDLRVKQQHTMLLR